MEVLFLTIFLSLILAGGFIASFVHANQEKEGGGLEQQSLMPLDDSESTTSSH